MNEARVLSRPSQSRRRRQRAFYHRSRVDIGSRFKLTKVLRNFASRLFSRFSSTL